MTDQLDPAGYDLLQQLKEAGALTSTGLTLTDVRLPYSQAEALGALLGSMHSSLRFAIGDWLLFIEQVYPSKWSQAAEVLGLEERTCQDYMRVSQRVAKSIRRPAVKWSQHRAVAALEPPAQKQWLAKVESEKMSHHALRDALRNGTPEIVQTACRCCGRDF